MNLETVNLDDYLARNAIPQFITDLESAWRDDMKNAGQNTKPDPSPGTNYAVLRIKKSFTS